MNRHRKLLVTGSNGFVAGSIIAQAPKGWEVHGIARSAPDPRPHRVIHHQMDLLDRDTLRACFLQVRPDMVIHTAAMASIDFCQNNQDTARSINVEATRSVALLCKEANIPLIHCSTDTVFDGRKGFYKETDLPHPINYYAQTKLEAEEIVLQADDRNVVARLALVMGLPVIGRGNSFLSDMMSKWKQGEAMKFAENEIRTPINVISLGAALLELASLSDFGGIIHLGGNTRLNRYQMALEIAKALGYPSDLVIASNSNEIQGRAPRPNDASLDNQKATQLLKTPLLSLSEGLELILNKKI